MIEALWLRSPPAIIWSTMGVAMVSGQTALTRMPCLPAIQVEGVAAG